MGAYALARIAAERSFAISKRLIGAEAAPAAMTGRRRAGIGVRIVEDNRIVVLRRLRPASLFPDAETGEEAVQHFFDPNMAADLAERADGQSQILRD